MDEDRACHLCNTVLNNNIQFEASFKRRHGASHRLRCKVASSSCEEASSYGTNDGTKKLIEDENKISVRGLNGAS